MMRQFTLAFALALACAVAGLLGANLAHAQIGPPAGMAPATPLAEPGQDANPQRPPAATPPTVAQHLQVPQQFQASATGAPPRE